MPNVNRVILAGNLGRDPEARVTGSGKTVCNFSLATNDRKGVPTWHRIVAWDKTAEACAEYLSKGRSVMIEGRLQSRDWEDDAGNKRTQVEIVADHVHFLGGGQGE